MTIMASADASDELGGEPSEPTVLFVDDERPMLEVFEARYGSAFDVRTADSAEAAFQEIDDQVDFAFVDRRMPDRSGAEVIREFRERGYDIPVGFLSAINPDSTPDVEHAAYLTKPVDKRRVKKTVAQHRSEQ